MKLRALITGVTAVFVLLSHAHCLSADTIHIAVASNFAAPMKIIARQFEHTSAHTIVLMSGSTGKHYAQIKNGAPVNLFFAADIKRPYLLEKEKIAQANTRFTYAIGKLVLWSPKEKYIDPKADILKQNTFSHMAIANPKLAPYGKAAQQTLTALGLWGERLSKKLVRGENISQTFQYIKSGNAQLGFIAASQTKDLNGTPIKGAFWKVPQSMYDPIEQQAVVIKDTRTVRAFLAFFAKKDIKKTIHRFGYDTK